MKISERTIQVLAWLTTPLALLYLISMFAIPWTKGGWNYTQEVWRSWQSLNTGVLAFLASVAALNIARLSEVRQRQRDFVAAKAFLPEALSELVGYFGSSASLLTEAWLRISNEGVAGRNRRLNSGVPVPPAGYKDVFRRAIQHADPRVGEYLARILMLLQIHCARIANLSEAFREGSREIVIAENLKVYLYRLAELQALVGKVFDYARGLDEFDNSPLGEADFKNAFGNLSVDLEDIDDLWGFTKRAIGRQSS